MFLNVSVAGDFVPKRLRNHDISSAETMENKSRILLVNCLCLRDNIACDYVCVYACTDLWMREFLILLPLIFHSIDLYISSYLKSS